jgi:hypothetical protein
VAEGFEAQRNVIYDLVPLARLSGLVSWSSTIIGSMEPADVLNFHQQYQGLPLVSVTQPVQGVPTLSVDSYQAPPTRPCGRATVASRSRWAASISPSMR